MFGKNQMETMAKENSGTAPKLREYGQLRGYTMQRETLAHGGVTIDLSSPMLTPATNTSGYYVSQASQRVYSFAARSDVRPYQKALYSAHKATGGTGYVGTWEHAGRVYASITEHFEDLSAAMQAGHERGQLAIFDIAAGRDIEL